MTAVEILKAAIDGAREGLDACHAYPNAVTPNMRVAQILQHLERAMTFAYIEIEKGNVK